MKTQSRLLQGLTIGTLIVAVLAFSEYILLFLLLLLIFWVDFAFKRRAFQQIRIKRSLSTSRLFENEPYELQFEWENPSPFYLNLKLRPSTCQPDLSNKEDLVIMKPKSKGKLSYTGAFTQYGKASIGNSVVSCEHPLGLFNIRQHLNFEEDIHVFPHLSPLIFNKEALKIPLPGKKAPFALMEDAADLIKVRPYEREPWNRIHWKISAKLDQWMSKEFGFSASGAVHILLDLNRPERIYAKDIWSIFRKRYERYALLAAARLLWTLRDEKVPTSLTCMGAEPFQQSISVGDPVRDLEQLMLQQGTDHPEFDLLGYFLSSGFVIQPSDTVVILSMHLDREQLPQLIDIRGHCAKVMAILFPYGFREEERLPRDVSMDVHPLTKELLNMATELSEHRIHVHFITDQASLQEGIHALPS